MELPSFPPSRLRDQGLAVHTSQTKHHNVSNCLADHAAPDPSTKSTDDNTSRVAAKQERTESDYQPDDAEDSRDKSIGSDDDVEIEPLIHTEQRRASAKITSDEDKREQYIDVELLEEADSSQPTVVFRTCTHVSFDLEDFERRRSRQTRRATPSTTVEQL